MNVIICFLLTTIILILSVNRCKAFADTKAIPLAVPPAGKYIAPNVEEFDEAESFESSHKIVCTYYFYWYDVYSTAHIINNDGSDALVDHPADMTDFSYNSVNWHKKELKDMMTAGIDTLLPVYWGDTGNMRWSVPGIEKLVEAEAELENEGLNPPQIGLFYDTSSLMVEGELKKSGERPDLTVQFGKELFYKMIRDFYSLIPSRYWFEIDGKPVVWLYSAAFASKFDKSTIDFARQKFAEDFGGKELYIIGEVSWQKPSIPKGSDIGLDNLYAWGAALAGPNFHGVAALGPGYDDHAVPGRTTPKREREDGKFYIEGWEQALTSGKNIVVIETWNELHEGTDVCETKEYDRQYIDLTSQFSRRFKK